MLDFEFGLKTSVSQAGTWGITDTLITKWKCMCASIRLLQNDDHNLIKVVLYSFKTPLTLCWRDFKEVFSSESKTWRGVA